MAYLLQQGNTALDTSKISEIEDFTQKHLTREPTKIEKFQGFDEIPISFIESTLDEIYLRLWGYESCVFSVVANEICCDVMIWVIDPQFPGIKITRAGTASLAIMMDACPPELTGKDRNMWAMSMENKKPFALKLQRPAVKQLALKNAVKSLGIVFGRNLNRKHADNPDAYFTDIEHTGELIHDSFKMLKSAESQSDFEMIWETFQELHQNDEFKKEFMYRKRLFDTKNKK